MSTIPHDYFYFDLKGPNFPYVVLTKSKISNLFANNNGVIFSAYSTFAITETENALALYKLKRDDAKILVDIFNSAIQPLGLRLDSWKTEADLIILTQYRNGAANVQFFSSGDMVVTAAHIGVNHTIQDH